MSKVVGFFRRSAELLPRHTMKHPCLNDLPHPMGAQSAPCGVRGPVRAGQGPARGRSAVLRPAPLRGPSGRRARRPRGLGELPVEVG